MPGNKMALILSLVCALIASGLVYRMIKNNKAAKVAEIPKIEVVCAKVAIPARSVIASTQLELRKIPKEGANPAALHAITEAVGLVTKSEILQGEPIIKERLLEKGQKYTLSFMIPPGMRAITVAIDEVKGVAGFVKPGERVDVVGTFKVEDAKGYTSWTLVQNVEVLALAQDMGEPVKTEPKDKKTANEKTDGQDRRFRYAGGDAATSATVGSGRRNGCVTLSVAAAGQRQYG